jgi:hypothetical protein
MKTLTAVLLAAALIAPAAASASGGTITNPTVDAAWMNGSASYSVTNLACATRCSWMGLAVSLPALYSCPDEPYTGPGDIVWRSGDYTVPGTVSVTGAPFGGNGQPVRLCLYLDRRDRGADVYLLAAVATFTQDSLPGPAEYFQAVIADPKPAVKPKRHARRHHRLRHR